MGIVLAMIAPIIWNWQMATPLEGTDREIVLMDAYRFGVTMAQARDMCLAARKHQTTMDSEVFSWNCQAGYENWKKECEFRASCWDNLWDALNPLYSSGWYYYQSPPKIELRMRKLYELRDKIGPEAFAAGVMPQPLPHYHR